MECWSLKRSLAGKKVERPDVAPVNVKGKAIGQNNGDERKSTKPDSFLAARRCHATKLADQQGLNTLHMRSVVSLKVSYKEGIRMQMGMDASTEYRMQRYLGSTALESK